MLIKICAIALTGSVAALVLSQIKGSFPFAVRIGSLILTLAVIFALAGAVIGELSAVLGDESEVKEYAGIVLRALGIALLGHFASLVCRELGSESLCFSIELAAKLEIFVLCLPLIKEIMNCALAILEM